MTFKEAASVKSNGLFKLLMIGYGGIFVPVAIIELILTSFEIVPVTFNNVEYFGLEGFLIALVTTPIYLFLMAGVTWVFLIIGLRVSKLAFSLFKIE
jgi:hypothetical protein